MNKRNKGKSKKPNNPQPAPSPKVAAPAEVLQPTEADGTTETKPEETRVPEIKAEVIGSALIETTQEDKAPEKPKRNRSKRNKNKNENIAEIPDDKVNPSVEIKLSEKEIESIKPTENRINNVATDPIPEKEVSQSVGTPTTTSRKKNKNKNKNKNADSQQATLIDQPLEAEKEEKAKIYEEVKKQKDAELTKLNLQIKAEKDQKQDNSENAPSAASRKKKGKNKNKSQSNTSDNGDKPVQYTSDASAEKSISSNTQDESTITRREISKNSEKNNEQTESNKQSDLKVTLNTLSPDAHKLVNLVTPDLEPITNLDFEIEESSDKPLSKSARKRAKKNQNKNQAINQTTHVVADLTKKDPIAQRKIENLNSKQDNNKLSPEKVNTVATNEKISSCPMNVLIDGEKKEQKEKAFLEEIKQSLDRSLEELITIENEQIDKIGTDAESIQSDGKQNVDNKLIGSDNKKEPEPADTIPVADNFQIADTPNKPLKDISEQPKLESEETCSETKAVVSEPRINEDVKKLQSDKIVSIKIEPEPESHEASKLNLISEIETKADPETFEIIEGEKINVDTQKTKTESNSSQESTKKETEIIHSCPLLQNLDLEKIEKSTNLVATGMQDETELNKNDKISLSEVITETTSKPSEQIHQKQNKNKLKNNEPAQVSETRETSVPILKEEKNKMYATSQKHEEIIIGSAKENEQKNKIVEKSKEIQNISSKGKDKGKNNMPVDAVKTATVTTQPLESVKEKQIPETLLIDSNIDISKETISKEAEPKNKPVLKLYEKLEETSKDELSDDLEIFPELIPLTVLEVQNENHTLDSILITPEIVKDVPEEFSVPDELPYVQLLAPKQDKGKGKSKKEEKISEPPSPKPTEDIKQSTAEIVEKDILKLVQAIDSADSKPVITKQDDIDAAFEMIAQGAIKKNVPKENSQPSTAQPSNQKVPADKIKTDKLLQEENTKGNRSKNVVGLPDIPVISNKEDYKKEKNKKGKNKSKDATTSAPSFNGGQKQKDGFGSEGDDEEFIYKYSFRKVFMANACHICKASLKSHRLVCIYCNLVSYCGQKHKDEDWPQHQALCFAISTIVHLKGLKFVYADAKSIGGQDYRLLRMQTIVSCEKILKRKLSPCEQEILLYPRMCLDVACREWRSAVLKDCDVCGQISYCKDNPSHFLEEHKKWCDSYKLYYKLVAHQQHKGRIEPRLPTKVISDTTFQLPANTTDLVKELYEGKLDLDDIHYAALTQIATAPLTALYGYQQYHKKNPDLPKDDTSFTIHVVGAELQFEADMLSKWEVFFLHLHPATVDLKVVFIGPELNPSKLPLDILSKIRLCKECRQAKRNLTFEFQDGLLYHNFAQSEKFSKPNLVCAFNPGLHRTTGYGGLDTWPDTIKVILALGCPICVTSYTSYELPRDLARLQECWPQVHIQTEPQLNPYASVRPDRNFISDDEMPLIFKNYCFMVVTG